MSDTDELRALLRERHSGSQWALCEEVHDSTGYARSRSCDAIAMNLWPSKGLELHGFEIKTSRSDYLNEIRDPDKADTFKRYMDRWWLVGSSKAIVKKDLPAGWGFMWPRNGKLVTSVGAPKLEPLPLPREMLAALLRRAVAPMEEQQRAIRNAAYREGLERGKKSRGDGRDFAWQSFQRLKRAIDDFEQRSGIRIKNWNGGDLGEAVKLVRALKQDSRLLNRFERLEILATSIADDVRIQVAAAKKVMEVKADES